MALSADDVMLLLSLLLGTGQRILRKVQAVEALRLGGDSGRGRGKGRQAKPRRAASASSLSPLPLHLPKEGTLGTTPALDEQGKVALVQRRGWGLLLPAGENTFSLPGRRTSARVAGAGACTQSCTAPAGTEQEQLP